MVIPGFGDVSAFPASIMRTLLLVLTSVVLVPKCIRAQNPSPANTDSVLRSTLVRINTGRSRVVRLGSNATGRIQGQNLSLRGDTVTVLDRGIRFALPVADVDSVWVRRSRAGLGWVIGAASCALVSALLTVAAANSDSGVEIGLGLFAFLATLSGGVCGGAGAILGSPFKTWRLEFARSPDPG